MSLDVDGHVTEARVGEALRGLHRICADVRYLGSYPRHDGAVSEAKYGTTDEDFTDASTWLTRIRKEGRTR